MTHESRRLAGILLIVLPTVMFGGVSILSLLIGDPTYMKNPLRQDLWRAGHAHPGVWLILALEFELAADVLHTAISPTWDDVGMLAAIAAIRTVLNYFLEKDIETYAREKPASAT